MGSTGPSDYALIRARSIAASSAIDGWPLAPEFVMVLAQVIDGTRAADDVIRELQVQYRRTAAGECADVRSS